MKLMPEQFPGASSKDRTLGLHSRQTAHVTAVQWEARPA